MSQTKKKKEKNTELIEMIPGSLFFTIRIRTWVGVAWFEIRDSFAKRSEATWVNCVGQ